MKLTKHAWMIWAIALIAVVALMVLIPFERTAAWWVAACCTILMFGLCAYTFARAFHRDDTLESKVLGWPIFKVGYTALIVQIIVGAIIMGIAAFCPVWAAAIAEVILFAFVLSALTVRDAARETVASSEQTVHHVGAQWKAIRARANSIADETRHPDIRKLAEDIRYADPTPTALDGKLVEMLETLSSYATAENIEKARQLLRQRNELAKSGKTH